MSTLQQQSREIRPDETFLFHSNPLRYGSFAGPGKSRGDHPASPLDLAALIHDREYGEIAKAHTEKENRSFNYEDFVGSRQYIYESMLADMRLTTNAVALVGEGMWTGFYNNRPLHFGGDIVFGQIVLGYSLASAAIRMGWYTLRSGVEFFSALADFKLVDAGKILFQTAFELVYAGAYLAISLTAAGVTFTLGALKMFVYEPTKKLAQAFVSLLRLDLVGAAKSIGKAVYGLIAPALGIVWSALAYVGYAIKGIVFDHPGRSLLAVGVGALVGGGVGAVAALLVSFLFDWDPCFITTATCIATGEGDQGTTLTTLRKLRDRYLRERAGGHAAILEYQRLAPAIVATIQSRPESVSRWHSVYHEWIKPAVDACRAGKEDRAYWLYSDMVRQLLRQTGLAVEPKIPMLRSP